MWFDAGESTVTLVPGIVTDYSATTQLVTIESAALDGNVSLVNQPAKEKLHWMCTITQDCQLQSSPDGVTGCHLGGTSIGWKCTHFRVSSFDYPFLFLYFFFLPSFLSLHQNHQTQVFHVASSGVRRRSDFTDGGQNNDAEEGIDDMISLR